uniref:glucose-6-phosphate 1-epimerase n=1 Tax=Craspedostauros australis TaxID=1486917 RepID=A0A7R9WVA2_9STRA|eukprot:CAMPEP_0198136028 /NCGR_PEP_ID=MMETSP1442-20131203/60895_1 /TAXON_ID= /ORGANISM="Craspedostauros australis, Strain CCMP3328" /LENGTH=301 /DNA_ID=CAMNT_0043797221 /DNA_START=52 /DNA_END=957 /DNA_ORIENTATION=+
MTDQTSIFTLTHSKSGSQCKIHSYGATVISFKAGAEGRECLFLSRDAKMDGSKAIRGGIPLVFPQFGQPDKSMPQHGFLRRNTWTQLQAFDDDEAAGVSYQLALKSVQEARGGIWAEDTAFDCVCTYDIKITPTKMITTLSFENTGDKAFEFQTLQHTYFHVDDHAAYDPTKCFVKGLEGYNLVDKIDSANTGKICGSDSVVLDALTDRVYEPPSGTNKVDVAVGVGGSAGTVKMVATGTVDGKEVPVSCVVWNPFKDNAASMSDFGDDQYVDMICVEPGILGSPTLEPGKVAKLCQEIEV